jgi:hypothetical protein
MNAPTRRPLILKAASVIVAVFALLGFVAAAAAGAKKASDAAADAGTKSTDAGVSQHRDFFPASKSAGGFYPRDSEEETKQQQSPAQQQK